MKKHENTQALYSIEQGDDIRHYKAAEEYSIDDLLNAANDKTPFLKLMDMGEQISIGEYAEIQQSDRFSFSVEMNLDTLSGTIYEVNGGNGGIAEGDRTDDNIRFTSGNLSELRENKPVIIIKGCECIPKDTWEDHGITFKIGQSVDDPSFYYARATDGKITRDYEYDREPDREKVMSDHADKLSEEYMDHYEAEHGADGYGAFSAPDSQERAENIRQMQDISHNTAIGKVLEELGIEKDVFNFSIVSFDGNEPFVLNGRFYDETDIEATEQFSEYIKGKDYSHWLTGKEFAKASVKIEEYAIGGAYSEPNDAFEARNATPEEVEYISNNMDKVLKCAELQRAYEVECRDYRDTEKKPSVLGKIQKIKSEQKAREAAAPQKKEKLKSNNQEL